MRRYEPRRDRGATDRSRTSVHKTAAINAPVVSTAAVKPSLSSALVAVVSIRHQTLTVWDRSGVVIRSRVSTGQAGHSTPTGLFSVIQKDRYHESNIYSGAPMPWMHRITWSGIALHAGVVPNYPASHGCIRLPYDVAPRLWAMSRVGMRVVVTPDDAQMQMVESGALPQPKLLTVAELDEVVRNLRGDPPDGAQVVLTSAGPDKLPAPPADRLLNPTEVAQRLKKEAAVAVELRKRTASEALAVSAQASAVANAAGDELRAARAELEAAEAAVRDAATGGGTQIQPPAVGAPQAGETTIAVVDPATRLRLARVRVKAAVAEDAVKNPQAFAAARTAREAEIAADEAPELAKEAARRVEPVSIFISGKEGQIFVRQGFEQVLDVAIQIADPIEPLGTHVFTAMSPDADGGKLKWSAVSMPSARGAQAGAAIAALERITIPAKVRDEIARRLWTGASLIISDEGISHETGKGTDFVVLTK